MFKENVSLKPYNTFGIEAKAQYFALFASVEELKELFERINNHPLPYLILGGGSNLLLTQDFNGYVLKNEIKGYSEKVVNETESIITVGAGMVWHSFVLQTLKKGWNGLENLSLIPGSVGASPMQNIGAYGVEIKDRFDHLEAFHIESGTTRIFTGAECAFGYRESVFKRALKNQYVITKVGFRLSKVLKVNTSYGAIDVELENEGIKNPTAIDISNAVIRIRESKLPDPKQIGNAGSFFKNPVVEAHFADQLSAQFPNMPVYDVPNANTKKLAAGWLIEQVGLKGYTLDTHGIHKKQALVLVNYGGATGQEVLALSTHVIEAVQTKFGVVLEREVNII